MKSVYQFIISPLNKRYNNTVDLGGKDIIINTDISNFEYISREAKVISIPTKFKTPVKEGDTVIVHHNIFRRWYDVRGNERNSSSYISEDRYTCSLDQIFMYKRDGIDWSGFDDYCFISPIKNTDKFLIDKAAPLKGVIEVSNPILESMGLSVGDVIGFTPNSEYEFVVDGKLMYRMTDKDICYLYEKEDVEVYNPQWTSFN